MPAGRFLVHAAKPGYVAANYGAPARDKPGLLLVLAAGQHVSGLQMSLARGAALSGGIVDESGAPVVGADVSAVERVNSPQGTRWASAAVATSDDRGSYRLFGLGDGQYVIAVVRPDLGRAPTAPRPAGAMFSVLAPARSSLLPSSPHRPPGYAPVFYPSTTDPAAAGIVSVRGGSDQSDLDLTFRAERAGEVEGRLVGPAGLSLRGVRVTLVASAGTIFATLAIQGLGPRLHRLTGISRLTAFRAAPTPSSRQRAVAARQSTAGLEKGRTRRRRLTVGAQRRRRSLPARSSDSTFCISSRAQLCLAA